MKRRTMEHGAFSIVVLLAISLVAFASPVLAQTTVSIGDATVAVDGETTLPIVINNVDDVDGVGTADIKLSFDSDVVHVTASTSGDFDSITPNLGHNESGADSYVRFVAVQSGATGLTSGAIVTTVTLKAVGTAGQESPLDIAITILADNTPDGNDISADAVNGTFTIPGVAGTTVSIGSATVAVDGETTLPIVINNVDDVDGVGTADIKLSFDSDVVHVTASTSGDFDSITPNLGHNESGADSYVRFVAVQSGATGLTSGAIVTTVTLKAVGTAGQESPLDIAITILADNTPDGNDISADDVDGTFTVVEAGVVTLTWGHYPEGSVTQGDTVTIDVMFSEAVDYHIRIENSTNSVVWRDPASGTDNAMNPGAMTWTTTGDTPAGVYTAIVNINGADDPVTKAFTITDAGAIDTTDPIITLVTLSPTNTVPGGLVTVTVVATDNVGIASVTANGTTGTTTLTSQGSNTWQGTVTAPSTDGTYGVTVVATDTSENAVTDTLESFTVAADATAPTISSVTLSPNSVGPSGSVIVTVVAIDASGVASVTANGTTGTTTLTSMGNDEWRGTITAPSTAGTCTVTVVATDASPNANARTDTSKSFTVSTDSCTITLSTTGYTLISMPLNDPGISTASDLANRITGCTEVVRYDETTGAFVSYVPGNPLNDFAIVMGRGYFVNGATVSSVTFYGSIWT